MAQINEDLVGLNRFTFGEFSGIKIAIWYQYTMNRKGIYNYRKYNTRINGKTFKDRLVQFENIQKCKFIPKLWKPTVIESNLNDFHYIYKSKMTNSIDRDIVHLPKK